MTPVILLLLAAAWAAFLLPPLFQNRGASLPTSRGTGMYDRSTLDISRVKRVGQRVDPSTQMTTATQSQVRSLESLMPTSAQAAARRRRDVMVGLGVLTLVVAMLVPVFGAPAVLLAVVSAASLGGFCYLVVVRSQREAERLEKVRPLRSVEVERHDRVAVHQPLRRSVGL